MKIAVLVLCHKNPEQIEMLINALDSCEMDFYIHVDRKSEIRLNFNKENVVVLPENQRISVSWGGYSMIEATLSLLYVMRKSGKVYDYVWLISGQDFPIRSINDILYFFDANKGKDFIEIIDDNEAYVRNYLKRNELKYPNWMLSDRLFIKLLKRAYWILTGGKKTIFFKRNMPGCIRKFYFGSQWWALTSQSLNRIMEFLDNHAEILTFFSTTLVPDECFFQTLYMETSSKNTRDSSVCFVNWGKSKRNPECFTKEDFEKLLNLSKKYLIARKFDVNVDEAIIHRLNEANRSWG